MSTSTPSKVSLIDIGFNLLDGQYEGKYHHSSTPSHPRDIESVLSRSLLHGVSKVIVTCGNLEESIRASSLFEAKERFPLGMGVVHTVGVHPTRLGEFEGSLAHQNAYVSSLLTLLTEGFSTGRVVAIGECGIDFDRQHFCSIETQMKHFDKHFQLSEKVPLPMFLHDRNTNGAMLRMISSNRHRMVGGVVHSFTGTMEEMKGYVEMGLFIGVNGCSLKTDANLEVVKAIPLDRLLVETDSPYCSIKQSHSGWKFVKTKFFMVKAHQYNPTETPNVMVKDRNEPCTLIQVVEIIAALKGMEVDVLAKQIEKNTMELFWPKEPLKYPSKRNGDEDGGGEAKDKA